jgi:C_GCAxxG_C_C family probable redox protein
MSDREALIQEGLGQFDAGYTCSEVVLVAGLRGFATSSELAPRIATGFGGGLSRTQSLCGALAGGVLVLGAVHGRNTLEDDRTRIVREVQQLVHGFRSRFGSDNCFALTGLDFNTPEGMQVYRERVHAKCREYVRYVLEVLHELAGDPA